jgi:hypothetical protein
MPALTGSVVRAWRRAVGWDVPETARRLRLAAGEVGETVPAHDSLVHMIRRWEREDSRVSERYELLYRRALGQLGSDRVQPRESLASMALDDLTAGRRSPRSERARTREGEPLLRAAEQAAFGPAALVSDITATGLVAEDDAAAIENATAMFRAWDNAQGGGLRRAAVIGQLTDVTTLLDGPFKNEQAARRCYSAVADLAQLAGWMTWDLQLHGTAQQYYLLGLSLARDAGDRPQVARMMYCLSRQMIDLGRPTDALDLATAGAYAIHRQAPPKATALLLIAQARAHACLGSEAECRAALGAAQAAFTRDAPDPSWCGFFDDAELAGLMGVTLRDLAITAQDSAPRIAAEARNWTERAANGRPATFLRSKILDTDGIAITSLLAGEPERAAAATADALALTGRLHSPRTARRVRATIEMGARYYPHAAPWEDLAGRARALAAAQVA